ncbi:type II secretory pathway, component PulL [Burkholderiales bacterium JOSHI_001]|nr:type II secretory pathway, component PulL [Burkholderiales bacterium JOSHI_001]
MSTLVVLLPSRARLGPGATGSAEGAGASPEYTYTLSPDGTAPGASGQAVAEQLPRAESVVAVVGVLDLSFHPVTLPKAPAARLRAALAGVLEEQLLDEEAHLHFAVSPQASAGKPAWVAVLQRDWLAAHLARLEKAGHFVERVVPALWPGDAPLGHFFAGPQAAGQPDAAPWLALAQPAGVTSQRLGAGATPPALLHHLDNPRFTAEPAVAAAAERWLGAPVQVQGALELGLLAQRSLWNLRQFELAPQHRSSRALRDLFKQWRQPAWRPVRLGLAALVGAQLLGLNLWAWHQRQSVTQQRQAQVDLLKRAHPQVRAVLDAPLQMQRETELLRAAAGRPGEGDLEALLAAAASAWPDGRPPVDSLRFEPGRLMLNAAGLLPQQVDAMRERLAPAGWAVQANGSQITFSRAAAAKS